MGKQNAIQSFFTNDRMMLVLVLVNTIAIFVGGFFEASTFFIWSDSFFTILFVIEAIVKISTYGWKDYWKDGWNRFDFILTVVAIPSLMNSFLDFDLATNILLSLRALRIFKSFRLFKFIPNVDGLLKGFKVAARASLIVIIAFVVIVFVTSILASTLYSKIVPDLFGNPGVSLYTIFRYFSGDDWGAVPVRIAQNSSDIVGHLSRTGFAIIFFAGELHLCGRHAGRRQRQNPSKAGGFGKEGGRAKERLTQEMASRLGLKFRWTMPANRTEISFTLRPRLFPIP